MDAIREAQKNLDHAKEQLRQSVRQARREGRTWADIGDMLGMSRQAAFKRFGEVIDPVDGRKITGVPMSLTQIRTRTEQVFDLIATADYEALEQMMHPEVREELSASKIAMVWSSMLTEFGAKESYEDTHVTFPAGERIEEDDQILGTVVGVTTVTCEAGERMGRVAFDEQQRIVGLLVLPPETSPLPF
ncbi:DUF3887 domain-containing protein [Nesterenkonia aerolata]|uniref:DUF3887 domain-containing protein n=1 Tax=Nesterenkonia aerolata TaxID=3074079 RepID=A0ABU2DTT3_9MICC|nr:DUF3887 domain-containing protein [Nesterenkonia sp. LY-0111]MDR8019690.1 DUF3887 domain-containing protein [Nesterenkonia sp. LY-0111]